MKPARVQAGHTFKWVITGAGPDGGDEITETVVEADPCPKCCETAIVQLPPSLLKLQPDGTTHVCAPFLSGCNHGFELKQTPIH